MEPASADEAYSGNLVQIDGIPTPIRNPAGYTAPIEKRKDSRPQSLFKFHPDFDDLIGNILACPGAELLLCVSRPEWTGLLEGRFQTIPDVIDRIGYLVVE